MLKIKGKAIGRRGLLRNINVVPVHFVRSLRKNGMYN